MTRTEQVEITTYDLECNFSDGWAMIETYDTEKQALEALAACEYPEDYRIRRVDDIILVEVEDHPHWDYD